MGKKILLMSPVGSFMLLMTARLEVKNLLTGDCNFFFFLIWKHSASGEPGFCWFSPSKFASVWRNTNGSHIQSTPELGWVWTTQQATSTSNQEVLKLEWEIVLQDYLDHGSYKYRSTLVTWMCLLIAESLKRMSLMQMSFKRTFCGFPAMLSWANCGKRNTQVCS